MSDALPSRGHVSQSEALKIAEWLESPQCGLMGDERVQRAASLLRQLVPSERTSRDAVIEECARQCYGLTISPGQPIAVISLYGEVATKCAERIRALKGENK